MSNISSLESQRRRLLKRRNAINYILQSMPLINDLVSPLPDLERAKRQVGRDLKETNAELDKHQVKFTEICDD